MYWIYKITNLVNGKIYNNFKEIEEDLKIKIDSSNIIKNIQGKTKSSYKYEWEYVV